MRPRHLSTEETGHPKQASVGRASVVMAIGTLMSRLSGSVRTFVFLSLGLSALTDAYWGANNTPNMMYELIAGGVLSATLVPVFSQLMRRDTKRARDGVNAIVSLFLVVVIVGAIILAVAAPLVMSITMSGAKNAEKAMVATQLLRLFAPQVIAYGFVTVATALLNVRRRYFAPVVVSVLNNVVVIAVVLRVRAILRRDGGGPGSDLARIAADTGTRNLLALGTTVGVFTMAVALLPTLKKAGIRLRWHWDPRHPAIREMVRLSLWTLGYVASNQIAGLVIINLANRDQEGLATAYSAVYQTYFLLPHGLIAVSIATAIQPRLAEAFLDRKRGQFRSTLRDGIATQIAVMVPAAVGYVVLATPLMGALRFGSQTTANAEIQATILRSFAFGLPAFSVFLLLMNACKAMRDTKRTFQINGLETAINLVLALAFWGFGWGVPGLAGAYALSYCFGCLLAFRVVSRKTKGLSGRFLLDQLGRTIIAAAVMASAVAGISWVVRVLLHSPRGDVRWHAMVEFGCGAVTGVTVYAVVAQLLGVSGLTAVTARIRNRRLAQ